MISFLYPKGKHFIDASAYACDAKMNFSSAGIPAGLQLYVSNFDRRNFLNLISKMRFASLTYFNFSS